MAKRMRLPNGFGQISELKGRRLRNKFRAMVTLSWTTDGKPVRHIVGYFPSYNEAYKALMEYHEKKDFAPNRDITMVTLFEEWSNIKERTQNSLHSWKYCAKLYPMKVSEVKTWHIKSVVEADMPPSMHNFVKFLLNMMFDYAVEMEYTDKNYARLAKSINFESSEGKHHIRFEEDEEALLWENINTNCCISIMLIAMYSGWRPRELMKIKTSDVNINDWTFRGGFKTKAGKDRVVPIHEKVRPLVEQFYDKTQEYLFHGRSYDSYKWHFSSVVGALKLNSEHSPHDTRVTFVTKCKEAEVNDYAIKRMVGHVINDITEETYTVRSIDWLREEISKIV